jgi:hypothetical protein
MLMRKLRLADLASSPLAREAELFRKLQTATASGTERLRLTIAGRDLFLDGFVDSLDLKFQVEKACRELAPESTLVNRLRVAAAEERQVS